MKAIEKGIETHNIQGNTGVGGFHAGKAELRGYETRYLECRSEKPGE